MVDKVYSLACRWAHRSQLGQNTLHFAKRSAGDPTQAQFTTIATAWKDTLRPIQSSQLLWVDWVATQVLGDGVTYSTTTCRQIGGALLSGAIGGVLAGSAAGDDLPPHDSVAIDISSGRRGRSFRTVLHVGGIPESSNIGSTYDAATVVALQAGVDAFIATYGDAGTDADWDWVVFSRGIASGCFPDPNVRRHPLVHRQAGDINNCTANVLDALVTNRLSTVRSRRIGS